MEWGRCHGKGGVSDDVSTVSVHPDVINVVTCNVGIGCSTLSHHHLYKEKLENLVKIALADRLPELQNIPTSTDDENDSDDGSDGQDTSKGKGVETSSLKKIRVLHMKIRRKVRAEAWTNETAEVWHEVKEAMIREREGVSEIKGDEDKVGLDRSPESREL